MAHIEITLEPPDEEQERTSWVATAFHIDDDGNSGDGYGVGWGDTPAAALIMLAEGDGDTMLCQPGNAWCEYSEEALDPRDAETGPYYEICLAHFELTGRKKRI